MNKVWIGLGVAAFAAATAAAYVTAVRSGAPDLGPVGPNRDLAPDTLAVYVELPDLRATWIKMRATEAWTDLCGSKIATHLRDLAPMKDFLAAIDEVSKKAAFPIDADNSMKFLGRECSVGVALDATGGAPNLLVLTKLDVDALKKDLVKGDTDLRALWQEMQRRTGQCGFVVTPEAYRGHTIANAVRGTSKFHAALIGDTLAVASDVTLVRAAIDCRHALGERSIGHNAAFRADVKALPAGATAFEWYDLDALAANRVSFDAGLAALGAPPETTAAIGAVLDGTAGAHSCARAEVVPEGDLYRATWTYSKSADLFADKASPALRDLYFGDWIVYGEMHDVGAVAAAWSKSALCRNLCAGAFGKWWDKAMADPASELKSALGWFPAKAIARPAAEVHRPPTARPGARSPKPPVPAPAKMSNPVAEAADEFLDNFAVQMGRHLLGEELQALLNGEAAFGIGAPANDGDMPRVAWTIRLDVEGRLLALAAQGAMLQRKAGGIACEDCGTREVFSVDAPKGRAHWTLVGDALVLSNDAELVRQAARTADTKPLGPTPALRDAAAAFKPGWRGFLYVDMQRAIESVAGPARRSTPHGSPPTPFDSLRDMGGLGKALSMAAYVPDDFSSIEIRMRADLGDTDMLQVLKRAEAREPICWASLPDTTILHYVAPSMGVDLVWHLTKTMMAKFGGDIHEMESQFRDAMGMDLEREVLPALGHELSFAVTFKQAGGSPGAAAGREQPAIPGVLLGVEVKDSETVRRLLDRAMERIEDKARKSATAAPRLFVHEPREGVDVVRIELPAEAGVPVRPAFVVQDGYLFVCSDIDALRAVVDAKSGKGKRLADSPAMIDAAGVLGRKCATFSLVDWPRLLDQVAVYTPQLAGLFPGDDVKPPEFPENGDNAEWRRRLAEYEKRRADATKSGPPKVKAWIDSLRVIDYVASSGVVTGDVSEGTMIIKFSK